MKKSLIYSVALSILLFSAAANAEDCVITFKDHKVSPTESIIPAKQQFKIIIKNQDATPIEFESSDLNREILIGANSEKTLYMREFDAGKYTFFDEFHRDTATGVIIVK